MTLSETITSYTKSIYGLKGDKVKLIATFGDILIVEGLTRFPVHKSKVSDGSENIQIEEPERCDRDRGNLLQSTRKKIAATKNPAAIQKETLPTLF